MHNNIHWIDIAFSRDFPLPKERIRKIEREREKGRGEKNGKRISNVRRMYISFPRVRK